MAISICVGDICDEVGAPSFVHAFFSTVSYYGEPDGWGTGYPYLIGMLYRGHLPADFASQATQELSKAKVILSKRLPSDIIWDIDDLSAQPPWGDNISSTVSSLGDYFVTSAGSDLFEVFEEYLLESVRSGQDAYME